MIARQGVAGHAEDIGGLRRKKVHKFIAKGASRSGGSKRSIRVRAQVLRDRQAPLETGGPLGFVLPDQAPAPPGGEAGKAPWRQSDVRRAIAAAEKAGLREYRIEIDRDGTIAIVVGGPGDAGRTP